MASSVTQIIYLTISPDKNLTDTGSESGTIWSTVLDMLEAHVGFQRLYWGRSPEDKAKVKLHVGRCFSAAKNNITHRLDIV
jgi:hypothetical protein